MQKRTDLDWGPSPRLELKTHWKRYGYGPLDGKDTCWFVWPDLVFGGWASRKQPSGTYMGVPLVAGHMHM